MWKRRMVVIGLVGAMIVLFGGGILAPTTITYHATCARCLIGARGGEKIMLGVRYREWLRVFDEAESAGHDNGEHWELSKTYAEVFGAPCPHAFKRGGMGRSTLTCVACGAYSDERAFKPRTDAVEALFRLYGRVPDKSLARVSQECIDACLKADATTREAHELENEYAEAKWPRLPTFAKLLNLVATTDEWLQVNRYAQSGFAGPPPLLTDVVWLKTRVRSEHFETRHSAMLQLMDLPTEERWEFVSQGLDDPDREICDAASYMVTGYHRLELFGKMLRARNMSYGEEYLRDSIEEADIAGLLKMNDSVTDELCFNAIRRRWLIGLLEPLLEKLNRTGSAEAREAIQDLLLGPKVFGEERDCWASIKPSMSRSSEMRSIIKLGTGPKVSDPRKWSFLNACKGLAAEKHAPDWDLLHKAYLREVGSGVNETYAAVMAKSLSEIDSKRTADFLKEEIKLEDHHRLTCAFAAMGLLASPEFFQLIEAFQKGLPTLTRGHGFYDLKEPFKNPYYGQFLEYAHYRCSGGHLRSVKRDDAGRHVIAGPGKSE